MKLVFAIIQRIFYAAILLLAVIVLNFFMMHLAPGDIADSIAQTMGGADEEIMNEIRADYGLDKPFLTQLGQYIFKVAQFDLGYSYFYTQPVTTLILAKIKIIRHLPYSYILLQQEDMYSSPTRRHMFFSSNKTYSSPTRRHLLCPYSIYHVSRAHTCLQSIHIESIRTRHGQNPKN